MTMIYSVKEAVAKLRTVEKPDSVGGWEPSVPHVVVLAYIERLETAMRKIRDHTGEDWVGINIEEALADEIELPEEKP